MAQTREYNHITVTTHADDDIVIRAGANRLAEDRRVSVDDSATERESDSPSAAQVENDASSVVVKDPKPAARNDRVHATPADAYKPTSLEDIESSKMPKAQIIVVVLAVLAVVAFVVWYVFFS